VRVIFFGDVPHRLAGAQRSLLASLTRIGQFDVEPIVVFPADGLCTRAYRDAGIATRVVPGPPSILLFGKKLLGLSPSQLARVALREIMPYARAVARVIEEEQADAAHFNTPRGMLAAGMSAKLARRPTVLHLRGVPAGFSKAYWMLAQLLADRIILVARCLRQDVFAPFRRRCDVVYNGVVLPIPRDRVAARRALSARFALPALADESETLFVTLSSPVPFKGLHHLLDAAAALRQRGLAARYVLAGSGPDDRYEAWLARRRHDLGLDDIVHTCGFVEDPLSLLSAADALVLPSVDRERLELDGDVIDVHGTEGLPRAILEAMSLGVIPVASDVVGVSEQIEDGVTGVVVPPSDPRALADALGRVAADPAWRSAAGDRARDVVAARFTIEASARGLADVLHAIVR
jgi:glycosyltransferase involved in cell wall biosynthesis